MKFKINQDHFSNGLQQVLNVVGAAVMVILRRCVARLRRLKENRKARAKEVMVTEAKAGKVTPKRLDSVTTARS